jgi:hypothetical protein
MEAFATSQQMTGVRRRDLGTAGPGLSVAAVAKPTPAAAEGPVVRALKDVEGDAMAELAYLLGMESGVWSVSAYRENFYVRNAINRYGVTSGMPLKYNADGSLDIYIQARAPGGDRDANWLPCPPSDPFNLTIRAYQPKKSLLDGTYKIPPVQQVVA